MERHYFVDYEIYGGGHPVMYGHLALTWETPPGERFSPQALIGHVCQEAADKHGAELHEIRVRSITRL